jgi:hypothetical protein
MWWVIIMTPRGSHRAMAWKPLLWWAGIVIAVLLSPTASPAQVPGASSPTAGIAVTGIAGGSVKLAIVEMGGLSYVVGVGDRIRDFTVMAISGNEVVLRQRDRTFRLSLARAKIPATAGGVPSAVAIPAAATPVAPAATPMIAASPVAAQPTEASTAPLLPTSSVTSVNVGPTGYPAQTTVPVWGAPLTPAPPSPPVISPGATLYTPSGTSAYGTTRAPITTQSAITRNGVTGLPVASSQVQSDAPVTPPNATLYTPSGTSAYGTTSAPITTQSAVSLRGVTALPVASNQAQSVAQVLPRPASGQAGAAARAAAAGGSGGGAPQAPAAAANPPSQPAGGPAAQRPAVTPATGVVTVIPIPPAPAAVRSVSSQALRGSAQLYQVKVGPISDQRRAKEIAKRLTEAGFAAKVSAAGDGHYTVTLNPSPRTAVGQGLAIIQSVEADVPIKIELVP